MSAPIFGMMASFDQPDKLLAAVRAARDAGYRELEAYSPFSVEGLPEALGITRTWVPFLTFCAGLTGTLTAYGMMVWSSVWAYPFNIGGRPYYSWPAYIPITFELTVLFAAFGAFFGMWWLNGLPKPYHPVFNARHFELASRTRFFLCVMAGDPMYDPEKTRHFLWKLGPEEVDEFAA